MEESHFYHHAVALSSIDKLDFAEWIHQQSVKMHELISDRAVKVDSQNKKSIEMYKSQVRKLLLKKKESIHRELDKFFDELL